MRLMDVKRLAASYGLAIYTSTLGSLLYVELFYWKLVWGSRWLLGFNAGAQSIHYFGHVCAR